MILPTTLQLKGSWPLKRQLRLSYGQTARLCYQAGWKDLESLTTAVAVTRAESGGDPNAYLAYLRCPGSPDSPLKWLRNAYETNRAWVKAIPDYPGPTLLELQELLVQRRLNTKKPWLWVTWETVKGVPVCDYGLFQLNSRFLPITPTPIENARIAHRMWKTRGFSPWVAFDKGYHKQYMEEAEKAARKVLQG
jgi:hypothetical protein